MWSNIIMSHGLKIIVFFFCFFVFRETGWSKSDNYVWLNAEFFGKYINSPF
jgi:hypothetical protein